MKIEIINKTSHKFSRVKIKNAIINILKKHNVPEDSEISVVIVNDNEMYKYAKKYLTDETEEELKSHPVLSFPSSEVKGKFVMPTKHKNYLGEIVISWDKAKSESAVCELVAHGTLI